MSKDIHLFCDMTTVDHAALNQFYGAMECPFAVKGAVLPDVHKGYSLPIGSVVATKGVVVPSWVGYDIGCGVGAIETNIDSKAILVHSDEIYEKVKGAVPMGTNIHQHAVIGAIYSPRNRISKEQLELRKGFRQIGTLGGGNHFIEIGRDANDHVWVVVHSGSRGVGHGVAGEYMKLAAGSDKAREGHFPLDVESDIGKSYIEDLDWALQYALLNRATIIDLVMKVLFQVVGGDIKVGMKINRNHNHAELKDGLWIHRKGATHADKGMLGVVPGNMRDGSFIVMGLGNPDSICSSSHGAGRVRGRGDAKKNLSMVDFENSMKGIKANITESTLDESPMAYKDIFQVMEMQKDLVEVKRHIRPIINWKG